MKRKVWGWTLFVVGAVVIRAFWGALTVSQSLPGETNYSIIVGWIAVILLCLFGWYRLALKRVRK